MTYYVLWDPDEGYVTPSGGYTDKVSRALKFRSRRELLMALGKFVHKEDFYIKRVSADAT